MGNFFKNLYQSLLNDNKIIQFESIFKTFFLLTVAKSI